MALGPVQSQVVAAPSGHVVFVRDEKLVAQRLDVAAGRLTGDATVLAEGLALPGMPGMSFVGRFSDLAGNARLLESEELRACPNSESSTVRGRRSVPLTSPPAIR